MRKTSTTTTVTAPAAMLNAAEALLLAVCELKKALDYWKNMNSASAHELAREALFETLCGILVGEQQMSTDQHVVTLAEQVMDGALDSGKNIGQQLVGGMGWTVIPTYEEVDAPAVVSVLCPIHRATDCSPMLNGCSYGRQPAPDPGADAVARYRESSWVINGGAADYGS